jgi:hypothetical protein
MRRRALLSVFGAVGHRGERRVLSLASLLKRNRSSLEVPLNPARATSRRGSQSGDASSARLRASVQLAR